MSTFNSTTCSLLNYESSAVVAAGGFSSGDAILRPQALTTGIQLFLLGWSFFTSQPQRLSLAGIATTLTVWCMHLIMCRKKKTLHQKVVACFVLLQYLVALFAAVFNTVFYLTTIPYLHNDCAFTFHLIQNPHRWANYATKSCFQVGIMLADCFLVSQTPCLCKLSL